jgi:hypothetical protein
VSSDRPGPVDRLRREPRYVVWGLLFLFVAGVLVIRTVRSGLVTVDTTTLGLVVVLVLLTFAPNVTSVSLSGSGVSFQLERVRGADTASADRQLREQFRTAMAGTAAARTTAGTGATTAGDSAGDGATAGASAGDSGTDGERKRRDDGGPSMGPDRRVRATADRLRERARSDPRVALVELRDELRDHLFGVVVHETVRVPETRTLSALVDSLRGTGAVEASVLEALAAFDELCDGVIRGERIDDRDAREAVRVGTAVLELLGTYEAGVDRLERLVADRLADRPALLGGRQVHRVDRELTVAAADGEFRTDAAAECDGEELLTEVSHRAVDEQQVRSLAAAVEARRRTTDRTVTGVVVAPGLTEAASQRVEATGIEFVTLSELLG